MSNELDPLQSAENEFLFQVPTQEDSIGPIANDIVQLAALGSRLSQEERALLSHPDGRPENVAEHANMLTRIAPIIAERHYPKLNPGLVSIYATIHDDVEAYIGDTPTYRITESGLKQKDELEQIGLDQLKLEYAGIPEYVAYVEDYEAQEIPEARFVRLLDKMMPLAFRFYQGDGQDLNKEWTEEEFKISSAQRSARLKDMFPEYTDLVAVRDELAALALQKFYNQ